MFSSHTCPKCRHNRILLVAQVPDINDMSDAPSKIATAVVGKGLFGGTRTAAVGHLNACVCRKCGYTELYTVKPEEIPIDGEWVRELVGPDPTPFR